MMEQVMSQLFLSASIETLFDESAHAGADLEALTRGNQAIFHDSQPSQVDAVPGLQRFLPEEVPTQAPELSQDEPSNIYMTLSI
jgi:hypothetical protein